MSEYEAKKKEHAQFYFTLAIMIIVAPIFTFTILGIIDTIGLEERIIESKEKISLIPCDETVHRLAIDDFSFSEPHGFYSEYDMAKEHYRYDCLGEERKTKEIIPSSRTDRSRN